MSRLASPTGLLVSACLVHAVLIGGAYLSLPPFFEAIVDGEGWSLASLQRAWAYIPLGSGISAFVAGRWLRTHADRGLLVLAGVASVGAVVLRGVAGSEWAFGVAQLLYGVGSGGLLVVLMARVTRTFDGETAGRAQAAYFSAYTIGAALGVASAEALAAALGDWRAVAFAWAGLSLVSLLPAFGARLEAAEAERSALDEDGIASAPTRRGFVLALAGYACVNASFNGGYLGVTGLMPYQLREWDWSPAVADSILALSTIGFIVGSAILGALTDRFGHKARFFAICLVGAGLTSVVCVVFARDGFHPVVVAGNALIGVFCGAFVVLYPVMLSDPRIPVSRAPEAIGWITTASALGGFLLPFLFAGIAESHPEWVLGAYAVAFCISGGVMALVAREGNAAD